MNAQRRPLFLATTSGDELLPPPPEPTWTHEAKDSGSRTGRRNGPATGVNEPGAKPQLVPGVSAGILAAQRSVIGAILADNSVYEIAAEALDVKDFNDEVSAILYGAIVDIIEGKIPGISIADPVAVSLHHSVARRLTLADIQAFAAAGSTEADVIQSHVNLIRNDASERNLGEAVLRAREVLAEDRDVGSKADSINQLMSTAYEDRSLPTCSLGAAAVTALTDMAAAAKDGKPQLGISYGLPELDALTAGLHGGELVIIAARPGVGKTALALAIGISAAAAGRPAVMASMEMKAVELSKRAISVVTDIDGQALRIGALNEDEWERAIAGAEYLLTLPFECIDTPGIKCAALARRARKLRRQGKLDLLMVDYLQIMTPTSNAMSREQQISEISRTLKMIAMELNIPVIALSQLSRASEARADRRPQLTDLRESGSLEQDADVVLFVHREEMGKKGGANSGLAELILGKQRAGPLGDIPVNFDGKTTKFTSRSHVGSHKQAARVRLAH